MEEKTQREARGTGISEARTLEVFCDRVLLYDPEDHSTVCFNAAVTALGGHSLCRVRFSHLFSVNYIGKSQLNKDIYSMWQHWEEEQKDPATSPNPVHLPGSGTRVGTCKQSP